MARLNGSNRDRDPYDRTTKRVILEGTDNYSSWKTDCLLELKKTGLAGLLKDYYTPPINPNDIGERSPAEAGAIKLWLSEDEEEPEAGWTAQKVTANRARWRKAAVTLWKEYQEDSTAAFAIIYRSCASHIQPTIANHEDGKSAWELLESTYGEGGYDGVYTHLNNLCNLRYSDFDGIEQYTNKFKESQQVLERQGKSFDEDIWHAFYLRGLSDKFQQVRWDVTYATNQFTLNAVIARCYSAERNFIEKPIKGKKDATVKTPKGERKSKGPKHCDYYGDNPTHDSSDCKVLKNKKPREAPTPLLKEQDKASTSLAQVAKLDTEQPIAKHVFDMK